MFGKTNQHNERKTEMKQRIIAWKSPSALAVILLSAGTALGAGGDEQSVREAATRFYSALNVMFTGDLEPMKNVWSHAKDVTYMGPGGGFRVGWSDVLKDWESQAAMKLGGKVEAEDMRVLVGRDLAITQNYEKGENKGPDGKSLTVHIRATNVFRKEKGEWKMISHHTDLLPHLKN
jgi:ketosteroid isomerase-like protein